MTKKSDFEISTLGLKCPEPIMIIRQKIRKMENGETLMVYSDDPSTVRDIPSFCRFMEHELLSKEINSTPYKFLIKKK